MKRYGIYLAYPPTADLRDQGLGRHLAMLLKGADKLDDVCFVITCPSWSRETLKALFESEQVSVDRFEIVSPNGKPYVLRCFELLRSLYTKARKGPTVLVRAVEAGQAFIASLGRRIGSRLVSIHGPGPLMLFLGEALAVTLLLLCVLLLASPGILIVGVVRGMLGAARLFGRRMRGRWSLLSSRVGSVLRQPHGDGWVLQLYDEMLRAETRRMHRMIDGLSGIRAWYCPTAFWPSFNEIKGARLMCVPDVVLADFPGGFAMIGGDRYLSIFETVGRAIRGGEHFATYSNAVKWDTLVDRYAIPASSVAVIPHAPSNLGQYVVVSGFPDREATSRHYCQTLLRQAFGRSTNGQYAAGFVNGDVKFLFYASQLRPNKNVLLLLRAYEYLLRKRHFGHKLLLTGKPADMPDIKRFVVEHRLENDVLFLHGLSVSELAACYKLADLGVNPSLSEGGCPFTFSEALSVGTPVVMARIPVTEEVLTDPDLQRITFFDPYDWQDCAERIEWGIRNREELLSTQFSCYEQLSKRTWADVAREYVDVLDAISVTPDRIS